MKKYYDILNVNEDASAKTIKNRYLNLAQIHHPANGGVLEKYSPIKDAFRCLIGFKHEAVQFNTLFKHLKNIAEISVFYLHYDKEALLPGQETPVFDLSYYAHGEIIKLCQHILRLFEQQRVDKKTATIIESLPKEALLPCVNKILSSLQRVYQFDHYHEYAGGHLYFSILDKVHTLFQEIRPQLTNDNKALFLNNPHKRIQDPLPRPSILAPIIEEIKAFIQTITEEPINERIIEEPIAYKRFRFEFTAGFEENQVLNEEDDNISEISNNSVL